MTEQQQQPIKVKFFPHHAPMETRIVSCLEDIQKLVGGWVELVHFEHSDSTSILANEEGRVFNMPTNIHHPAFVGNIVVAPSGWEHLPYSKEEVSQTT